MLRTGHFSHNRQIGGITNLQNDTFWLHRRLQLEPLRYGQQAPTYPFSFGLTTPFGEDASLLSSSPQVSVTPILFAALILWGSNDQIVYADTTNIENYEWCAAPIRTDQTSSRIPFADDVIGASPSGILIENYNACPIPATPGNTPLVFTTDDQIAATNVATTIENYDSEWTTRPRWISVLTSAIVLDSEIALVTGIEETEYLPPTTVFVWPKIFSASNQQDDLFSTIDNDVDGSVKPKLSIYTITSVVLDTESTTVAGLEETESIPSVQRVLPWSSIVLTTTDQHEFISIVDDDSEGWIKPTFSSLTISTVVTETESVPIASLANPETFTVTQPSVWITVASVSTYQDEPVFSVEEETTDWIKPKAVKPEIFTIYNDSDEIIYEIDNDAEGWVRPRTEERTSTRIIIDQDVEETSAFLSIETSSHWAVYPLHSEARYSSALSADTDFAQSAHFDIEESIYILRVPVSIKDAHSIGWTFTDPDWIPKPIPSGGGGGGGGRRRREPPCPPGYQLIEEILENGRVEIKCEPIICTEEEILERLFSDVVLVRTDSVILTEIFEKILLAHRKYPLDTIDRLIDRIHIAENVTSPDTAARLLDVAREAYVSVLAQRTQEVLAPKPSSVFSAGRTIKTVGGTTFMIGGIFGATLVALLRVPDAPSPAPKPRQAKRYRVKKRR